MSRTPTVDGKTLAPVSRSASEQSVAGVQRDVGARFIVDGTSMKYFRLINWRAHQHYSDRNPPWIKFYTSILDPNGSWAKLDDRRRGQLANLLAYAARMDNIMPADDDLTGQEIGATSPFCLADFKDFISLHDNRVSCVASDVASKDASKDASTRDRDRNQSAEKKKKKKNPCPAGAGPRHGSLKNQVHEQTVTDALEFLNQERARVVPGARGYDVSAKCHRKFISARLKAGATLADLNAVILDRCNAWRDNEKMLPFLRPETLFNETKFNSYLANLGVGGDSEAAEERRFLEGR